MGALADGTPVVAGFLSYGSTGLHQTPGYEGFAIYPGSYGGALAQYSVSSASTYFSAIAAAAGGTTPRPTSPADAGSLAINVSTALDAAGQVLTAGATGGLSATIEISANDLVVGSASGSAPADAVTVAGSVLAGWKPGTLLLGGIVENGAALTDGSTIDVHANSVTIGAGTTLTADQIVLVANESIDVQTGATVRSTSAATGVAPAAAPPPQSITLNAIQADSNSAGSSGTVASATSPGFLAVSDLNWLTPSRTGAVLTGAGTVAIDPGATVASRGSLSIDALGGVALNGTLTGPGAEWSLGSSSIAFVPTGSHSDALSIDPALVAQLSAAGAVRLASSGAIDVLTPVSLGVAGDGSPTLRSLTLSAADLNNLTAAGTNTAPIQFGAQTLTLEGSGSGPSSAGVPGALGTTLVLVADTLNIGPTKDAGANSLTVNGFASTRAAVSGAVIGQGWGRAERRRRPHDRGGRGDGGSSVRYQR